MEPNGTVSPSLEQANVSPRPSLNITEDERRLTWMKHFLADYPEFVEEDDLGTILGECGTVILASIVFQTRSLEKLSSVSCFPRGFIAAVFCLIDSRRFQESEAFQSLVRAYAMEPDNLPAVNTMMNWVNEEFWWIVPECAPSALESLRRGVLFGGRVQNWVDQDALDFFGLSSDFQPTNPIHTGGDYDCHHSR